MRLQAAFLCLVLSTAPCALAIEPVDVGSPSFHGAASESHGEWDVTAGGKDIWGTSDEFTYICEQRLGDFDIAVQIESLNPAQLYSRIGLMARATLDPRSQHVFIAAFSDNSPRHNNNGGVELQYRQSDGGPSAAMYPPAGPLTMTYMVYYPRTWLRLKRMGNVFTAFTSQDGALWNVYGSLTLVQPGMLYIGVAVTSHSTEKTTQARFTGYQSLLR